MKIIITSDDQGQRLDALLTTKVDDISRTDIQNRLKSGHILVNQKQVKPNYKVKTGDEIEFFV